MLGWRGASRYYHPEYKEGFALEIEAVKKVREEMGLTNLKVMIPFCRTPEEGRRVLDTLAEGGLKQGDNELEVYVMAELPSNVFQAEPRRRERRVGMCAKPRRLARKEGPERPSSGVILGLPDVSFDWDSLHR